MWKAFRGFRESSVSNPVIASRTIFPGDFTFTTNRYIATQTESSFAGNDVYRFELFGGSNERPQSRKNGFQSKIEKFASSLWISMRNVTAAKRDYNPLGKHCDSLSIPSGLYILPAFGGNFSDNSRFVVAPFHIHKSEAEFRRQDFQSLVRGDRRRRRNNPFA